MSEPQVVPGWGINAFSPLRSKLRGSGKISQVFAGIAVTWVNAAPVDSSAKLPAPLVVCANVSLQAGSAARESVTASGSRDR